jgi:hypothetical protein
VPKLHWHEHKLHGKVPKLHWHEDKLHGSLPSSPGQLPRPQGERARTGRQKREAGLTAHNARLMVTPLLRRAAWATPFEPMPRETRQVS